MDVTETSALVYDWRETIAWLDQSGNDTERARLRGLLGRPRPDARVVRTLEARQNRDGGFPSDHVQGRPSSVETTEIVLRWMQDLNILDGPLAQRVVTYLFTAQRPDGSWDESLGLLKFNPAPRLLPGDPRVRALCTALAGYWLVMLGHRTDHAVSRALAYLRPRQTAGGRFLGFIRTTWVSAALLRLVEGPASPAAARALEALAAVPPGRWQAGSLGGMLNCLFESGVPQGAPLAQRGLERLRALAEPDGSWPSEEGEFYRAEVTLGALRALVMYGAVTVPEAV